MNRNFCPGVCLCRHTHAGCNGKRLFDCGSGIEQQKEGCQLEMRQNRETSVLRCLIPRGWSWAYCCTVFQSEGLLARWEGSQQDLQGYLRNGGPGRPVPGQAWAPGPCRPIPVGASGFLCPCLSCRAPKPSRAHPSSEGRVRIYHLSLPAKSCQLFSLQTCHLEGLRASVKYYWTSPNPGFPGLLGFVFSF